MDCLPRPLFPPVMRITLPAREGMSFAVKGTEVLQKFMFGCWVVDVMGNVGVVEIV